MREDDDDDDDSGDDGSFVDWSDASNAVDADDDDVVVVVVDDASGDADVDFVLELIFISAKNLSKSSSCILVLQNNWST